MLSTAWCSSDPSKWAASGYILLALMFPGCPTFLCTIIVVLVGTAVRESTSGQACSGDFYEGEGKPTPYLW